MRSRLTTLIFIGMLLGIGVGYACSILWPDPQTAKTISGYISLISDVFLRLIKMIIAPLVFSTLVVGIAHMGDTAALGRQHNDANVIGIGARMHTEEEALEMVRTFLATPFSGNERHARRIRLLAEYESRRG